MNIEPTRVTIDGADMTPYIRSVTLPDTVAPRRIPEYKLRRALFLADNDPETLAAGRPRLARALTAVAGLDLPRLLPGDTPARTGARWLRAVWHRPDGTPIDSPNPVAGVFECYSYPHHAYAVARDHRYRNGTFLDISTVTLRLNHDYSGSGIPVLWETMLFVAGTAYHNWRYSSRRAALHGHRTVLEALRAQDAR